MGRGAGPRDAQMFASHFFPILSSAVLDLAFLLERGYAETAALKLVGDHFQIQQRQRHAVMRATASPTEIQRRRQNHVASLAGQSLSVDGFNILILLEAATGGGVILHCADETYRDLSSIHGNYRTVEQTRDCLIWFGRFCEQQQVAHVEWWFDAPVSNSGRLVLLVRELAFEHQWPWRVQTDDHVDRVLIHSDNLVVSSDKIILNSCQRWTNLGRTLIDHAFAQGDLPLLWKIELPQTTERLCLQTKFAQLPDTITVENEPGYRGVLEE